jgi:phosphoesterase RecJ-like protein
MKSSRLIQRMLDAIRESNTICVVGHVRPDGDCIGSQLAVAMALKNLGKAVCCWNEDPLPRKLAFLDRDGLMRTPKSGMYFDCVVATDCASFERLGKIGDCIRKRGILLNIDHHQSNTRYGDINWVAPNQPSTGELIYRLLRAANWAITPPIADCLFAAISTDTGSFQYPTTRPTTFYVAGKLVDRGADIGKVCNEVYHSYPIPRVRLLRHVYNKFRLIHDDRVAYFWLKKADFARTGAQQEDSEGLIDHIRNIEPVVVACLFEELEPELIRVSLRSKDEKVDVNQIALQFGGGGHPAAAGARIPGKPLSVQRNILNAVKKALNSKH